MYYSARVPNLTEWLGNDNEHHKGKDVPYMYYYGPWTYVSMCYPSPQFRSTASRFRVAGHFETSAPNGCKVTLNTTRSKVPLICAIGVHESQISVLFLLRPAVFEWHDMASQVYPKMALNTKGDRHIIYALLVSSSPKFQFLSFFDQPLWSYNSFWDKCTKWPHNNQEDYKVKGTPYMCSYSLRVSIFTMSCSATSRFVRRFFFPKSQMPWITSDWPSTFFNFPKGLILVSFILRPANFQHISHFIIDYHINVQKRTKHPKISKFTIILTTLVIHSRSIYEFWELISCVLQRACRLTLYSQTAPYWRQGKQEVHELWWSAWQLQLVWKNGNFLPTCIN